MNLSVVIPLVYQQPDQVPSCLGVSSHLLQRIKVPRTSNVTESEIHQSPQVPFRVPSRVWQAKAHRALPHCQADDVLDNGSLGYAVNLEKAHRPSSHYACKRSRRGNKAQGKIGSACVPRTSRVSSGGDLASETASGTAGSRTSTATATRMSLSMATDTTESDGRIEMAGVDEMDGDDLYEEGEVLSDGDESGPLAMAHVLERVAEVPRTLGISGLEVLLLRGNDLCDFDALEACPRLRHENSVEACGTFPRTIDGSDAAGSLRHEPANEFARTLGRFARI